MKTKLLTAVAAITLSLGAISAAKAESPDTFTGITIEKNAPIAQTRCFYRYYYYYNYYYGQYFYQYRWYCY